MFQGGRDLDIVSEFDHEVGISIHEKPEKLKEARDKLDAGLGAELMKKCREQEKSWQLFSFEDSRYSTIILAAYMMQVGAKISPDDRAQSPVERVMLCPSATPALEIQVKLSSKQLWISTLTVSHATSSRPGQDEHPHT